MMKAHFTQFCLISIILAAMTFTAPLTAVAGEIQPLADLSIFSDQIKSIRSDIRKSLYITKSNKEPELLPELKFYRYQARKDDTFWKILASSSSNIDTLMTVNNLSTPFDITPGRTIYIPNMRGILFENEENLSLSGIARKFGVDERYIARVNNIKDRPGNFVFIPSGEISRTERSLFLGTGFICPITKGRRTSGFGIRRDPLGKSVEFHGGVDVACPSGSRVYAARSGKVVYTGFDGGYGLLIKIQHTHRYETYYGHLSRILVKTGDTVNRGMLIGLSGNTGRSTGPHLHFEVRKNSRPINPYILTAK